MLFIARVAVHRPRRPSRLSIMSDDGMLTAKSESAVTFHIDGVPYFAFAGSVDCLDSPNKSVAR
jgi:hypothetical protein